MTTTTTPRSTTYAGLGPMIRIEARRLARHPAFLIGLFLAFGVLALIEIQESDPSESDMLSFPVVPAFFIGLTSLVATARLARSTESAVEAMGTAPGSEARRTAALAAACVVPFVAGLVWVAASITPLLWRPVAAKAWWLHTMPDWQVWGILLALGPVACLGGGLLGVLTGRWLRFPGAPAVVVVALVAINVLAGFVIEAGNSRARLWAPWALWHDGGESTGDTSIWAGNPAAYLAYLLCLCAAAALVAIWHDRTARTRGLRLAIVSVTVVGLGFLALAITTGPDDRLMKVDVSETAR